MTVTRIPEVVEGKEPKVATPVFLDLNNPGYQEKISFIKLHVTPETGSIKVEVNTEVKDKDLGEYSVLYYR